MTLRADARYCSTAHRVAAHRAAKRAGDVPRELAERDRWVRYTPAKVPITVDGRPASSTDPRTWSTHREAISSQHGVGIGFVLGDGIGCIDLDHCLAGQQPNAAAAKLLEQYPGHYIEVSPSGDGLHIWGLRPEAPGTRRTVDGLQIETYSTGRYITVTGTVYQPGRLLPL